MTIEYLGANSVQDLFDIIAKNYVSKEEFEKRDEDLASAFSVGSALIAAALLKVAEEIKSTKGAEGGDEEVDENMIATDSEVNEVLDQYFDIPTGTTVTSATPTVNESVATGKEVNEVIGQYF